MTFDIYYFSDKGPRPENQDSLEIRVSNNVLIACIADGVGGSNCGSTASSESTHEFIKELGNHAFDLEVLLNKINKHLKTIQEERAECVGMATTFTGYYVSNNLLRGIHIGDTRLCILRKNGIKQITEDHTEVNTLLKEGRITREEAKVYPRRNVLERALTGDNKDVNCQLFDFNLMIRDRILLTTDGIHEILSKTELRDLSLKSKSPHAFGTEIINSIKNKRLTDNHSFVIAEMISE